MYNLLIQFTFLVARNRNGDTPLTLAKRFVAKPQVIELLVELENQEHTSNSRQDYDSEYMLLTPGGRTLQNFTAFAINMWKDFVRDLGIFNFILLVLLVGLISLYITYCITGIMPLVPWELDIVQDIV